MARDELFTFGDESLEHAPTSGDGHDPSGAATAVLDSPPAGPDLPWPADEARVEEGAQRSRGDSAMRSSEKRESPSIRVYGVVALVLAAGAVLLIKIAAGGSSVGPSPQADAGRSPEPVAIVQRTVSSADQPSREGAGRHKLHVNRDRAAERQRVRHRRSVTRRRAPRRRERGERGGKRGGGHESRMTARSTLEPPSPSPPAPEPPPPSPAAPSEPAPSEPTSAPTESALPPPSATEAAQTQFGVESGGSGMGG